MFKFREDTWGLILGGSSGIGLATAHKLSRQNMNLCLIHRDRRGAMERIEREFEKIRQRGVRVVSLNLDALSNEGRATSVRMLKDCLACSGGLRLLLHSIAFGNLKLLTPLQQPEKDGPIPALAARLQTDPRALRQVLADMFEAGAHELAPLIPSDDYPDRVLDEEDFSHTIYSMGTSLNSWVRDLSEAGLFAADARVIGLTSEGNTLAWKGYAAVAAAKSALESVSRAIAVEYAPRGIRCNVIQAGITQTPALDLIPGSRQIKANATLRNPFRRLTRPEDVAGVVSLLCTDEAGWINGAIIRADGGEHISSG